MFLTILTTSISCTFHAWDKILPFSGLANLTSSWTPSRQSLESWDPSKEGLPLLSSHPTLQARVSSLATADSDASTTLVSLLTLHVHTAG